MKVAKKLSLAYGYEVLVYETMKPESTTANNVVGEMVEVSRKLDLFGRKMKMKIIAPVQLTTNSEGKTSYLTSSVLASSKQIKEVAHLHFNRDFQEIIITLPFLGSLLYVRHCANNHFGNLKEQS